MAQAFESSMMLSLMLALAVGLLFTGIWWCWLISAVCFGFLVMYFREMNRLKKTKDSAMGEKE